MAVSITHERTGVNSDTYILVSTANADQQEIELNGLADVVFVNSLGNITADTFLLELSWVGNPSAGDWEPYANENGINPWQAGNSNERIHPLKGVQKIRLTRTGDTDGSVTFHISVSL